MILSPDDLKDKTVKELRAITTDYHASWHPAEKAETLINRICELSSIIHPDEKNPIVEHKPDEKKQPSRFQTPDEVLAQLEPSIECGLLVKFTDDKKTWLLKFRDKTDSGSMSMPLKTIQRCADTLLRAKLQAMPKCQLCGERTAYDEALGYICVNPACKRRVKQANPGKVA